MKLSEAYTILGLSSSASSEEAKKQYRKLTKEFHPDINKEPGAEDKFKKINEAYQVVQTGKSTDLEDRHSQRSPFHKQHVIQLDNVEVHLTVSFKDSVLGCKREVKYSRQAKCSQCDGAGDVRLNNGCKKCGGKGQTVVRQGQSVMITTCSECFGRSSIEECSSCKGEGVMHTDVSVHVSVPAGIINNTILRLQGMGNYAGSFMGFADQYTDAFCHVHVTADPDLSLEGKSVVSHLTVSLLDALRGCARTVKTIHGDKEIQVKPQSRNCDEVIIPHCGVSGTGEQRVILDVQYPKNIDKLVDVLRDEVK
jgi:molecular chaperone DnaJ